LAADKVGKLEGSLVEAGQQLQAFDEELTRLRSEIQGQQGMHQHVVVELEGQLDAARAACDELEQRLREMESEKAAFNAQVASLQAELQQLRSEAAQGGDFCHTLTQQVNDLAAQVDAQADALLAADATIQELQGRIQVLEHQLALAHAELAAARQGAGSPGPGSPGSLGAVTSPDGMPDDVSVAAATATTRAPLNAGPKAPRGAVRQSYGTLASSKLQHQQAAQQQAPPAATSALAVNPAAARAQSAPRVAARVLAKAEQAAQGKPGVSLITRIQPGAAPSAATRSSSAPKRSPGDSAAVAGPSARSASNDRATAAGSSGRARSISPGGMRAGAGADTGSSVVPASEVARVKAAVAAKQAELVGLINRREALSKLAHPDAHEQQELEAVLQHIKAVQPELLALLEEYRGLVAAAAPPPEAQQAGLRHSVPPNALPAPAASAEPIWGAGPGRRGGNHLTLSMTSLVTPSSDASGAPMAAPAAQPTPAWATPVSSGTGRSGAGARASPRRSPMPTRSPGSRYAAASTSHTPSDMSVLSSVYSVVSGATGNTSVPSQRLQQLLGITPPPGQRQAAVGQTPQSRYYDLGSGEDTPRGVEPVRPGTASAFIPPTPGTAQAARNVRSVQHTGRRAADAADAVSGGAHSDSLHTSPLINLESMADPYVLAESARKPARPASRAVAGARQRPVLQAQPQQEQTALASKPKTIRTRRASAGPMTGGPDAASGLMAKLAEAAAELSPVARLRPVEAPASSLAHNDDIGPSYATYTADPSSLVSQGAALGREPMSAGAVSHASYASRGSPRSVGSKQSPPWRPPGPLSHVGPTGAGSAGTPGPTLQLPFGTPVQGTPASDRQQRREEHQALLAGEVTPAAPSAPPPGSPYLQLPAAQLLSMYPAAKTMGFGTPVTAANIKPVAQTVSRSASAPSPGVARAGSSATPTGSVAVHRYGSDAQQRSGLVTPHARTADVHPGVVSTPCLTPSGPGSRASESGVPASSGEGEQEDEQQQAGAAAAAVPKHRHSSAGGAAGAGSLLAQLQRTRAVSTAGNAAFPAYPHAGQRKPSAAGAHAQLQQQAVAREASWAVAHVPGEAGVSTAAASLGAGTSAAAATGPGGSAVAAAVSSLVPAALAGGGSRRGTGAGSVGAGTSQAADDNLPSLRIASAAAAASATAAVMLAAANIQAAAAGTSGHPHHRLGRTSGGASRVTQGSTAASVAAALAGDGGAGPMSPQQGRARNSRNQGRSQADVTSQSEGGGPSSSTAGVAGSGSTPVRGRTTTGGGSQAVNRSPGKRSGSPSGGHLYLSSGVAGVPPQIIPTITRDEQEHEGPQWVSK